MKAKILLLSFLAIFTISVKAQTALIPVVNSMTNDQLWTALLNINLNNETVFAKCKMADATACTSCACDYYFKANIVGSLGMYGWPKNPASGDSTGCDNGTQWGGYSAAMATSDLKANARAMLLDALNNNACGTATPVVTTDSLNVTETAKFQFVDPNQTGGIIKCGTTNLGPQIAGSPQFTKLSDDFCLTAYYMALKAQANSGVAMTVITLPLYNNYNQAASSTLSTVPAVGQANQSYNLLSLSNSQVNIQSLVDTNFTATSITDTQKATLTYAITSLGLTTGAVPVLAPSTSTVPSGASGRYSSSGKSTVGVMSTTTTLSATEEADIDSLSSLSVPSKNITSLDQFLSTSTVSGPAM